MGKDSRIYVAGHSGLVGSAIYRKLLAEGYDNLVTRAHADLDLQRQTEVEAFFKAEKPGYVFLAAAKVGGIWANQTYPAEFIYNNLSIQTNVIHAAWRTGVERLLFMGSSCIYPRDCPQPMKEEYLLSGPLEPTNRPYAVAKIAGLIQCEAYNRQYGAKFLALMPTNLYGPNDNFDLETSHVLPAMIRKFHLANLAIRGDWDAIARDEERFGLISKEVRAALGFDNRTSNPGSHSPHVVIWGSGRPRREFLHVDDLADACLFLMNLPDRRFAGLLTPEHALPLVNIGCGQDRTIHDLAELVARVVGYEGEVVWDQTRPDGTPRKTLEVSRLKALGWTPRMHLEEGIGLTYRWYLSQLG